MNTYVDYKIVLKALSIRIQKILPEIIHSDQSAFVKGRLIGDSIRSINDIMEYAKEKNRAGMLLFLDY